MERTFMKLKLFVIGSQMKLEKSHKKEHVQQSDRSSRQQQDKNLTMDQVMFLEQRAAKRRKQMAQRWLNFKVRLNINFSSNHQILSGRKFVEQPAFRKLVLRVIPARHFKSGYVTISTSGRQQEST